MQRHVPLLAAREFDVLVIGAGAFGAAAARDAALRGLDVALIDAADFGGATSAECFKIVHGGIRYLQHADLARLRSSCAQRSALLRMAPHLVNPLPIAIPTYGRGRRGRLFLGAGACVYDLLTLGRNAHIRDPARRVRRTRWLSRTEVLSTFPHLEAPDLSGAVVFEDGQMYNPPRLVLAFVKASVAAGATVCNYVEALNFLWKDSAVCGVRARDRLSGEVFDIRAKLTLNAAGPWADYLERERSQFGHVLRQPFSRDACFVVERAPTSVYGLAVQGLSRDKDALLSRAARHLFAVPWRGRTLFGVWHRLFPDSPDKARVEHQELERWIAELNMVYPALELSPDEVTFANCGLVPFGDTATDSELSFGKESRLVDHRKAHDVTGLVTLVGIRFTTARADARRALDLLLEQHPRAPAAVRDVQPLPGGDIEEFAAFERQALAASPAWLDRRSLRALLRNHGTEYRRVLALLSPRDGARAPESVDSLPAEIAYAVREEMAVRLDDVVRRRTELGTANHPGRALLEALAAQMASLLGWSTQRTAEELEHVERMLSAHLARPGKLAEQRHCAAPLRTNSSPGALLPELPH